MRIIFLILLLICSFVVQAQEAELRVGFWNVQNLFDTINDPGVSDGMYTPLSKKKWDSQKYNEKVDLLAQVVSRLDVDLLGLCEVENRGVVEDLVRRSGQNFNIVHFESCDPRGIDQAILYDSTKCKLIETELIKTATDKPKREILYCSFAIDADTILFYVMHLPSKLGGEKAQVNRDRIVSQMDSIVFTKDKKIVVMGDMNNDPIVIEGLVNCADRLQKQGLGSYTYRGVASMLDQILVSPSIKFKPMTLEDNYSISHSNRKKKASDHMPVKINLRI